MNADAPTRKKEIREIVRGLRGRKGFLFKDVFAQSKLPSAIMGLKGQWIEVNEALCQLLHMTEAELKRTTWQKITHPDSLSIDLKLVEECLKGRRNGYVLPKKYLVKGDVVKVVLFVSYVKSIDGSFFLSQVVPEEGDLWKIGGH